MSSSIESKQDQGRNLETACGNNKNKNVFNDYCDSTNNINLKRHIQTAGDKKSEKDGLALAFNNTLKTRGKESALDVLSKPLALN